MEHAQAVELNAVERYLLGELGVTERDAFEEHFFECPDCAADVRAAASFIINAREVMRRTPGEQDTAGQKMRPPIHWLSWLHPAYALAIIAVLLLAIGYQSLVVIPKIRGYAPGVMAQALPTLSLMTSGSRGEAGVPGITVPPDSPFGIYLDIPPGERFRSYSCAIRTRDGKDKLEINVTAAQARDSVELFIPGGALQPGSYEAVIFGHRTEPETGTSEVARYRFAVRNSS